MVCVSVCLGHDLSPAKTDGPIEVSSDWGTADSARLAVAAGDRRKAVIGGEE